jgi:TRAP-type C4-dicarboxylate transport system permease small subunit
MRKGAHIAAELVIDCLPALPRKIVVTTGRIGVLLFLAICVWYGLELVNRVSFQSTIALGVSMQLPYAAVPVGSALMIYHMLVIAFGSDKAVTRDTEIQI